MVGSVSRLFVEAPRLREFFAIHDTVPSLQDGKLAPGRFAGRVAFKNVTFCYDPALPTVVD